MQVVNRSSIIIPTLSILLLLFTSIAVWGLRVSESESSIGMGVGFCFGLMRPDADFSLFPGNGACTGGYIILKPITPSLKTKKTALFLQIDFLYLANKAEFPPRGEYKDQAIILTPSLGLELLPHSPLSLQIRGGLGPLISGHSGKKDWQQEGYDLDTFHANLYLFSEFNLQINMAENLSIGIFAREGWVAGRLLYLGLKDANGGNLHQVGLNLTIWARRW